MSRKKISGADGEIQQSQGFDAFYAKCISAIACNEKLHCELKAGEHTKALCHAVVGMGRSFMETAVWLGRADVEESFDKVVLKFPSYFYAVEARQRFGKELRALWPNKTIKTEPPRPRVASVLESL